MNTPTREPPSLTKARSVSSRLRFLAVEVPVLALIFLVGCGRGPEITITWKSPKPGLEKGVPLVYESVEVGKVAQVSQAPEGVTANAVLHKKTAHYVRTKSSFAFLPVF